VTGADLTDYGRLMKRSVAMLGVVAVALLACKSDKKKPDPVPTAAPTTPKLPFTPSADTLQKVCDGQAVPGLDPLPREQARGALFVKKEPSAKFEHVAYDDIVGTKNMLAVTLDKATVVACIAVTKKKKNKACVMTPVDKTKLGGTLTIYDWEYTVTLRETATGKVLSESPKKRSDTKCPDVHIFEKTDEDLEPPFAISADLAVSNYRDGK
jgi:hypothetical protein